VENVAESPITRDKEIQGGTPVFTGTRVPVEILLDYLEDGQPLENFLAQYPNVSRELAVAALEEVKSLLARTS
jgi:uncharacterized protein (DUF433 family)